jgi:hypothetical protein
MATETVYLDFVSTGTAQTATLANYYSNILVENLTTGTGSGIIWVRADGIAAVSEADDNFAVSPGQSLILSNGLAIYDQGLLNVAHGTLTGNGPNTGFPYAVQPYGTSLAVPSGGYTNPGCHVSVILDSNTSGTPAVQVAVSSVD